MYKMSHRRPTKGLSWYAQPGNKSIRVSLLIASANNSSRFRTNGRCWLRTDILNSRPTLLFPQIVPVKSGVRWFRICEIEVTTYISSSQARTNGKHLLIDIDCSHIKHSAGCRRSVMLRCQMTDVVRVSMQSEGLLRSSQ